MPSTSTPVTVTRPAVTWTLKTYTAHAPSSHYLPVSVGTEIQDEEGDPFVITGAEWNPLVDEREPVLLGYWPSIGQTETDAGGAQSDIFPDVRWTWLANN